jgi:hypothetical protein
VPEHFIVKAYKGVEVKLHSLDIENNGKNGNCPVILPIIQYKARRVQDVNGA